MLGNANCVHTGTLSNSATNESCTMQALLDKCIAVCFFPGIMHRLRRTMKALHLFVRLVARPRRLEVGFSHYLMLNWISISKDSGLRSIRFMKTPEIETLTLNWIILGIRIITVVNGLCRSHGTRPHGLCMSQACMRESRWM